MTNGKWESFINIMYFSFLLGSNLLRIQIIGLFLQPKPLIKTIENKFQAEIDEGSSYKGWRAF